DVLKLAQTVLAELAERSGETAGIAVWTSSGPSMVRTVGAQHQYAGFSPSGHVCPTTCSATGLVFCTFERRERSAEQIGKELRQNARIERPGAPTSLKELEDMTDTVKRHGVSSSNLCSAEPYSAISAPVFNLTGELVMALTVFGQP